MPFSSAPNVFYKTTASGERSYYYEFRFHKLKYGKWGFASEQEAEEACEARRAILGAVPRSKTSQF